MVYLQSLQLLLYSTSQVSAHLPYFKLFFYIGKLFKFSTSIYDIVLLHVCHFHHHRQGTFLSIYTFVSFSHSTRSKYSCLYLGSCIHEFLTFQLLVNVNLNNLILLYSLKQCVKVSSLSVLPTVALLLSNGKHYVYNDQAKLYCNTVLQGILSTRLNHKND